MRDASQRAPELPLNRLVEAARTLVLREQRVGVLTAVLWGSVIDVIEGRLAYVRERDVDVLAICANAEKAEFAVTRGSAMPALLAEMDGHRFDIVFADLSYIEQALANGRWTVVRAINAGPVIVEGEALARLRAHTPEIEPFVPNSWRDWHHQALNIMTKAKRLLDAGEHRFAAVLIRDAFNTYCHAKVIEREGAPATPSRFPELFTKHFRDSDLYQAYFALNGVDAMTDTDVKVRFLTLSDLLSRD